MSEPRSKTEIDLGATQELSLRVSVAVLARVLFENPGNGETMLALERRATVLEERGSRFVEVKSQPFGGAIRIQDLKTLQGRIGDFHFDSEHSRVEQDFRLFIRPASWEQVQRFCLQQFADTDGFVLESDPRRELEEEFAETLKIQLRFDQVRYKLVGTIIEEHPSPTENIQARGYLTARIYRVFEAQISDAALASAMLAKSENDIERDLSALALENSQNGEIGNANTILTLPLKQLISFYSTLPPDIRNTTVRFRNQRLDETVAAVVDVDVPKYRRVL